MTFECQETSIPPETTEGEQVSHSETDLSPEGIRSMQGQSVLSTEVLAKIAEVNSLETGKERQDEWGKYHASLTKHEKEELSLSGHVDEHGITLYDRHGQYEIRYTDDQ